MQKRLSSHLTNKWMHYFNCFSKILTALHQHISDLFITFGRGEVEYLGLSFFFPPPVHEQFSN